jgi:hypothetical protein
MCGMQRATHCLAISNTSIGTRETLRAVILDRLEFPNNSLIEYAVKAIRDWLGPDLAHLNDFPKFFGLIEHANEAHSNFSLDLLETKSNQRGLPRVTGKSKYHFPASFTIKQ